MKFPPHLSTNLTNTVKVGDRVTVAGYGGIPNKSGQEIRAYSITNSQTQRAVTDQPAPYPPAPPTTFNYSNLSVEGTVQHWLVEGRGEINSLLLSNGAQVKFPPHVGYQLSNVATGAKIQAQGYGIRNNYGQVLEAASLIVDGQAIAISSPPAPVVPPVPPR
ncbi:MAG: hypothetical protein ACHBN1_18695 [Heteroscytonema crispum UTEX LB 1556]